MAGTPATIAQRVDTFDRNKDAYKVQGQYKEAQLRQEFINPLFKALGWDISRTRERKIGTDV